MTRGGALQAIRRIFEESGVESPRREAQWIVEEVCNLTAAQLTAFPEETITDDEWAECRTLARRREAGEPIQYVLGFTEFAGLRIRVSPDTLIPRPETEQLVEHLLAQTATRARPRILDIGTGSGCIALAYKSARPASRVWACDVDPDAIRIAYSNSRSLDLPVVFFQADALRDRFGRSFAGVLDAVVSNPPYIARDEFESLPALVRDYEPDRALFAPDDPLAHYRAIGREARAILRPSGLLLFEVHEDRGAAVRAVLDELGFESVRIERDFAGRDRFAFAVQPVRFDL